MIDVAQLCSAVDDGHLYILPGQSLGTLQVSGKGEVWLRQHRYRIPDRGESIHLDRGTYLKLKDMDCLYTKGIEYDKRQQDTSAYAQHEPETISDGLPLVLRLREHQQPGWELALDLLELDEDTWKELQSHSADRISASDAVASLSQLQLLATNYLLSVRPRLQPYQIYRETGGHIKHVLREVPETPGLNSVWQGNVFSEYAHQKGTWRRRLPGRVISFSAALLWLAKSEYDPEWPGNTERVGSPSAGWQLWRLSVNEQMPASWEELQRWFRYRLINIAAQRQNLEVLSPPMAITADAHYVVLLGKQVLLACYPPSRFVEGLDKRAVLSAELLERSGSSVTALSRDSTLPFPADQVSYFRWTPFRPGEYRIRIQGDASADPLLIRVATLPPIQPRWLHGLICTVASSQNRQTFRAFNDLPSGEPGNESLQVDRFAREDLPTLAWTLEPEQLPIRVTWNARAQHGTLENVSIIRSGAELTQRWREYIWPSLATGHQPKMLLDAGSFGRVELPFVVPQPPQVEQSEQVLPLDERFISQFIWLNRMIVADHQHKHIPVPDATRNAIRRLRDQVDTDSSVSRALEMLLLVKTLPAWVCFRLRALLAAVEEQGESSITSGTTEKKEEVVR